MRTGGFFEAPTIYVAYAQNDTLKQGQQLRDYEQLISAGGVFRLGFFSPNPNAGLIGTAGARYESQDWTLTSWLSEKVPAPGAFRLGLDPSGANQLLVWRRDEIHWSSGVCLNGSFQSAPELTQLTKGYNIYDFRFVANEEETYFSYSIKERSILSRWDLDTLGEVTLLTVDRRDGNNRWTFETSGACHNGFKNSTSVCLTEKPTKCRNGTQSFVPKRGYIDVSEIWYDTDTNLALST
ncbi:G-type lectin S-receptor-like serine/threonine-protein kinase SD1-1 [Populus trichocarpa]|uniref:G-type lectin S-receptor-like serine/threonine-protein kinase SD1-1 n=1 Tax=Populus trichocarpa TaxID=3694 RepID=UPI000D18A647|nr:G-type lectin S-receptor-like serine/threonine-protein kinase SD1-1 [Populus trichocarpa]|eukprot:XP_024439600.1 G-type lectin S-receptor-like serine/threonine-protein kinase SD1-1 [Populus trichocarpa]